MEHMKESRFGDQAGKDISAQAEQILSLLERRGVVEDQSITNKRAREAEQELRRNMYHNTQVILKHYRDIVWVLECFPQQVAEELDAPCMIWMHSSVRWIRRWQWAMQGWNSV